MSRRAGRRALELAVRAVVRAAPRADGFDRPLLHLGSASLAAWRAVASLPGACVSATATPGTTGAVTYVEAGTLLSGVAVTAGWSRPSTPKEAAALVAGLGRGSLQVDVTGLLPT